MFSTNSACSHVTLNKALINAILNDKLLARSICNTFILHVATNMIIHYNYNTRYGESKGEHTSIKLYSHILGSNAHNALFYLASL